MNTRKDPARELISRANWIPIQEHFAKITGLSLLTHNSDGELICPPSQQNEICKLSQANPEGFRRCQADCGRHVVLAAQTGRGAFYKCHANLQVFSLPLDVDGHKIVFLGGKAYFSYQDLSEFRNISGQIGIQPEQLLRISKTLPFKEEESLKTACALLETLGTALFHHTYHSAQSRSTSSLLLTLLKILSEARGAPHPSEFAPLLLNTLGVLFNLETAFFLLHNPGSKNFDVAAGFGRMRDAVKELSIGGTESLLDRAVRKKMPVSSNSLYEILKAGLPENTFRADLFPIPLKEGVNGMILILNSLLSEEDIEIIGTFSSQISLLFENVLLQVQSEKSEKDLSLFGEISKAMSAVLDSEELFDVILHRLTQVVGAELGSLMVLNEADRNLSIKSIKGLNPKIVEPIRIEPGEGISGNVLVTGEPLLVQNIETDRRTLREKRPRYKTSSFISLPLVIDKKTIGVMNFADKLTGEVFSEEDLNLLQSITPYASVAIECSNFYQKTEELKQISITDPLTNLLNRRYFHERMLEEMERSKRHNVPLSLMILDIDNFKNFNDAYGHPSGDEALKAVAKCLRACIRTIDVAARYGGEEFTVILPQTAKQDAAIIAERICGEVKKIRFPFWRISGKNQLTISIGLASFPEDAESHETLINNADIALYQAKTRGKDRVVLFQK